MTDIENLLSPVLEKIAKEHEYDDYKTELKSIYTAGANYSSQLFAITLSAPGIDDLKLFAKVSALGEKFRQITSLLVFETEILFYDTVIPMYKEFEEKYNFPKEDRLIYPKYYGGSIEYMKETLVLEELTVKGYQPFDRFKCYDWEYASRCVSALARLHALSVRYEKCYPEKFAEMIQKLAFKFPMDHMKDFMEKGIAAAIGATDEENKKKLEKYIQKNLTEENMMSYTNPSRKVVLNHGDFRPSNVMHKRDEDGKLKVVLIDYQVLQKGNPISDLLYFLITGSDEEFRAKHMNQFFDHYYEEFSKSLRWLEIDPDEVYTKKDFDADVEEKLQFGIIMAIGILPMVTVEEKDAPSLEGGMEFEDFAVEHSDLFRTRFNGLIRDYVKMGYM